MTPQTRGRRMHWITEVILVVIVALLVAAVARAFVAQVFYIPSGSMEDTLHEDDWILVSKLSTQFGSPQRGDIVVFEDPGDWLDAAPASSNSLRQALEFVGVAPDSSQSNLVKRVIGVGGDTVICCDSEGRVVVNGTPLDEVYLAPGDSASNAPMGCSGEFEISVPVGYLWVMGDHRSVSSDSRCQEGLERFVPDDLVSGRAVAVVWPAGSWDLLQRPPVFDSIS